MVDSRVMCNTIKGDTMSDKTQISIDRLRDAWMTFRDMTRTYTDDPDDNDGSDFDALMKDAAGTINSELVVAPEGGKGYWKLHSKAYYAGAEDTEERIIALLDNADFLYFVWVLQEGSGGTRNEEALAERAEAKRIAIELIRGTQ